MKRWKTIRIATYGAAVGVAYEAFRVAPIGSGDAAYVAGRFVGAAIGGFILVAAVCGLRNLLVGAK